MAMAVGLVLAVTGPREGAAQTTGDQTGETGSASGQQSKAQGSADRAHIRRQVVHLLSGYHFTPSRKQFDEVGEPNVVAAVLRAIAADDSLRPSLRGRAVDVLALYDDDKTVAFLERLLAPADEELSEEKR
ncbi:MAG: hypothetical protein ABEN55_23320, partial [Bradymonadaceae bacterium]